VTVLINTAQASRGSCQLSLPEYDSRISYLERVLEESKSVYGEYTNLYTFWNNSLQDMEWGHNVATACAIVSAAALTVVGVSVGWTTLIQGESIVAFGPHMVLATNSSATAMFAGQAIEITKGMIGMTYFFLARAVIMVPADAYLIYRDLFGNYTDFGASIPAEQVQKITDNSELYGGEALAFLSNPDWSGNSTGLNNPIFAKTIADISNWQYDTLEKIGDSWTIFEYFTKDFLEQSAANAQAYQIASDIQRFQVFYWNGLLTLLKSEKKQCLSIAL
jgi:hypothetical protein